MEKREEFYFTYVLECSDQKHYIGSTSDLEQRFNDHKNGSVISTKNRRPLKIVYYEVCLSKEKAQARERYFKTGYGRKFLKDRI